MNCSKNAQILKLNNLQENKMNIDRVVLAERPRGEPKKENFRFEKVKAPKLQKGEV